MRRIARWPTQLPALTASAEGDPRATVRTFEDSLNGVTGDDAADLPGRRERRLADGATTRESRRPCRQIDPSRWKRRHRDRWRRFSAAATNHEQRQSDRRERSRPVAWGTAFRPHVASRSVESAQHARPDSSGHSTVETAGQAKAPRGCARSIRRVDPTAGLRDGRTMARTVCVCMMRQIRRAAGPESVAGCQLRSMKTFLISV